MRMRANEGALDNSICPWRHSDFFRYPGLVFCGYVTNEIEGLHVHFSIVIESSIPVIVRLRLSNYPLDISSTLITVQLGYQPSFGYQLRIYYVLQRRHSSDVLVSESYRYDFIHDLGTYP